MFSVRTRTHSVLISCFVAQFYFGFKMERPEAKVRAENVLFSSTQHAALCLSGGGQFIGHHVRVSGAKGTGMTLSKSELRSFVRNSAISACNHLHLFLFSRMHWQRRVAHLLSH